MYVYNSLDSNYPNNLGVIWQVEDTLFQIPQFYVESQGVILGSLLKHFPSERLAEKSSAKTPIWLDGIRTEEFEKLLSVLYPM